VFFIIFSDKIRSILRKKAMKNYNVIKESQIIEENNFEKPMVFSIFGMGMVVLFLILSIFIYRVTHLGSIVFN